MTPGFLGTTDIGYGYVCVNNNNISRAVMWGRYYISGGDYRQAIFTTFTGNAVKWFSYYDASYQVNSKDFVYGYVAFG